MVSDAKTAKKCNMNRLSRPNPWSEKFGMSGWNHVFFPNAYLLAKFQKSGYLQEVETSCALLKTITKKDKKSQI